MAFEKWVRPVSFAAVPVLLGSGVLFLPRATPEATAAPASASASVSAIPERAALRAPAAMLASNSAESEPRAPQDAGGGRARPRDIGTPVGAPVEGRLSDLGVVPLPPNPLGAGLASPREPRATTLSPRPLAPPLEPSPRVTPGSGRIEFEVVEEAAPRWLLAPEVVATIERRSATELTLAAAHVDEWIRHSADHLAGVLISPREAPRGPGDGGLVFAEVRSGSLFAHLGIEVGDVLLALNGRPVSSLEVAGQEVLTGRERGRLTARLQRRGQAFELELSLPGMPALRGAAQ